MTVYVDYSFYTTTFLGTAIAEPNFDKLALRASAQLDRITFNRAASETDTTIVESIKMATCQIAEELQRQDLSGGLDAVKSESQGRYSVTYAETSQKSLSNLDKVTEAAKMWLSNTDLLFKGFKSGEYASGSPHDPQL